MQGEIFVRDLDRHKHAAALAQPEGGCGYHALCAVASAGGEGGGRRSWERRVMASGGGERGEVAARKIMTLSI